jgi:mannose-6-phosphate isomerase-like protein (cupin superfamily)
MKAYKNNSGPSFVPPGHTKAEAQILFSRENGSHKASILITTLQVGGGSTVEEVHENSDQVFYVLQGTVAAYSNDKRIATLQAGDGMHVPAGEPHAFKNAGETPCKLYIVTVPPIGDTR